MKDPLKLQLKLNEILRKHPNLKVQFKPPLSEEQFKEIAWIVQDFVNNSGDVTNDDPLFSWLEEYHFLSYQQGVTKPNE